MTTVAIVIISWNGLRDTLDCLISLRRLQNVDWRAVLVDNASQDGTVEAVRDYFPEIHVIANCANKGYVDGNNQGIQWAIDQNADWILLLNNDIVMHPDSLSEMLRLAESTPHTGVVGPLMQRTLRPDLIDMGGDVDFRNGRVVLRLYTGNEPETVAVDYVWGCTLMARREIFEHTGGLNPYYVAYFEDAELCLRARRELGLHTITATTACVVHKVGGSGEKRFLWQTWLRIRNHALFFLRFARWSHYPTLMPALFCYHLPLIFVRSLRVYLARVIRRRKYADRPITLWHYQPERHTRQQIEEWLLEAGYYSARG